MSSHFKIGVLLLVCTSFWKCQPNNQDAASTQEAVAPPNALFQSISPAHSGITFSNNLKENIEHNIVTNPYLYNGGGVGIADFNNDGLEDLFFTSTQESCKLYLNEGNFKFKDITESAGVASLEGDKTGVTILDFNQDGYQDIYVARTGLKNDDTRRNLLYINQGNLTFEESARTYNLGDPSASSHSNFFDYDQDGDLDVYVLNYPVAFAGVNKMLLNEENGKRVMSNDPKSPYDSDRLYRNDGNVFTDVTISAGIINRAWGLSVSISDFNEDGYPDIYVGNDYVMPDFLYINQKNGTFKLATDDYFGHTSAHTMGIDIADINNDEKVDLIALDMLAKGNYRQKALMSTMIDDRYNLLVKHGFMHQAMRNVLQVNNGNKSFKEMGVFSGVSNTDWSWASLFADYDLDGHKDLFISNGYRRDLTDLDYINFGVAEANKDGGPMTQERYEKILDMIPSEKLQNYIFRNDGNLKFEDKSTEWGLTHKTWSNGAAYGDLDNDGDLDLVVNNVDMTALVYKNTAIEQGKGNYLKVKLIGAKPNRSAIGAKVRLSFSDGTSQYLEMTPTRGYLSSMQQILHFGFKDKTPSKLEVEFPGQKLYVLDQLTANKTINADIKRATPGTLSKSENEGKYFASAKIAGVDFQHKENDFNDFDREGLIPQKLSTLGPKVAVADVNGDKLNDFFVGGAANSAGSLFIQKAGGRFTKNSQNTWTADAAAEDLDPYFFDADKDGDLDLYVVSGGNVHNDGYALFQDRLYLNDGKGNFSKSALPAIGTSGSCIAAHDYDADGDLDLFVGGRIKSGSYPLAPNSYILKNEGGKFTDVTANVSGQFQNMGMVTDLVWANIDGDPEEELIVTGEWMPVSVFKVENGKLINKTDNFGLSQTDGWWHCVAADDIDNDGDLDLIAGNMGNNIRLKPTESHPVKMFAKDFDNNGQVDPVMAWSENGKYYPIPNRDRIIGQMPGLKKKFPRYTKYSSATIEEVFSPEELDAAYQLELKTLSSTVFLNDGQGNFTAKVLPSDAQIAPVNEIAVEDVNKDGKKDLILVGNNFGIQVESGRIDAGTGIVLLGDGKGNFSAVQSIDSGLWADGDARDIEPILINGKKHFIVAENNAPLKIFKLK